MFVFEVLSITYNFELIYGKHYLDVAQYFNVIQPCGISRVFNVNLE